LPFPKAHGKVLYRVKMRRALGQNAHGKGGAERDYGSGWIRKITFKFNRHFEIYIQHFLKNKSTF
jgi:hypothetical protein